LKSLSFTSPRWQVACVLLGVLLALPCLALPFAGDDFFHLANLEGVSPARLRWWELFTFAPGDPARREALVASGVLPWWSAADLQLAFFRPLSSALVVADHALFGRAPLGWHLHSLVWWAALLACTALLYRRVLPAGTALLSLLLFAVDDAHWMPIAWSAARNGMVAMVPALLGLVAHVRWRERAWRPGAVLAPLGFAVGLLGGEGALGVLAYVVAFEAVGHAPAPGQRYLGGLLPHAIVLALYALVRRAAGVGVSGSGAYVDPSHEPLRFAWSALGRVPALIGNAVFGLPAELWSSGPRSRPTLVVAGLLGLGLVAVWLRKALAGLAPGEARAVRWLAVGAVLALIPGAGAMLGERLLLPASLGAAVVFAVLLRDGARRWRTSTGLGRRAALAVLLAAIALPNLVAAPALLVAKTAFLQKFADRARVGVCREPLDGPGPTRAVVLWADNPSIMLFAASTRWFHCPDGMASWTLLSISPHAQRLTRTSAQGLTLTAVDQPLLDSEWEMAVRAAGRSFHAGDAVVQDGGLRITVESVDRGYPQALHLHFPRPIDGSEFRFFVWRKGGLTKVELPQQGASTWLNGARGAGP
jgi:hypothetical protein